LSLDIFNRQADKLVMANVAQLINNLHTLFLSREDKFAATPNFHVFEMYAAHHGGQSLRAVFSGPAVGGRPAGETALPVLAGSASLRGKTLVLTVVNSQAREEAEAEVSVRGASVRSGRVRILRADDIHAHNDFQSPHAVEPTDGVLKASGAAIVHRFPAASVSRLEFQLA